MKYFQNWTVTIVLVLMLVGCGKKDEPSSTPTEPPVMAIPVEPEITTPQTSTPVEETFSPITLVENDDISVIITGVEDDPIWGYTLHVYLENNTDKELLFSLDEVSVNRFMCDPFWAETVSAGMKCNSSIRWFESTLLENSITDIKEISFVLRVYDAKDFYAEDLLVQHFTITP